MSSRLGDLLQRRGDLNAEQLARALDQQREHGGALSTHLVRLGFITEETLLSYLQREYRLPVVDLGSLEVPREVLVKAVTVIAWSGLRAGFEPSTE